MHVGVSMSVYVCFSLCVCEGGSLSVHMCGWGGVPASFSMSTNNNMEKICFQKYPHLTNGFTAEGNVTPFSINY